LSDVTGATAAYLDWLNSDIGLNGDATVKLVGSWYNSAHIPSGPGHIQLTVTTHELMHSAPVTVDYLMPS
jgi:hypothetical protein